MTLDYETAHLSRIITAVRITEKISLDGHLEDPVWKLAEPGTDFIQQRPRAGEPSPERTEVRFLYDDDNLYVGVICFDSNMTRMVVNELQEDFNFDESDGISVYFDSLHDRRSGFGFVTNPAGAKRDVQISNDSQFNPDWDGVWDVKVSRNAQGWIAEYMIPFKTLRFSNSPSQEWGFNMVRRILRLNELSHWAPIPIRYNSARMSLSGTLRKLTNLFSF